MAFYRFQCYLMFSPTLGVFLEYSQSNMLMSKVFPRGSQQVMAEVERDLGIHCIKEYVNALTLWLFCSFCYFSEVILHAHYHEKRKESFERNQNLT